MPIDQLPDGLDHDQLVEIWRAVHTLHIRRITHRGLTGNAILLGLDGRPVLPIPQLGSAFASDLRLSLDRAQLLVTTAELVGAGTPLHETVTGPPGVALDGVAVTVTADPVTVTALELARTALPSFAYITKS